MMTPAYNLTTLLVVLVAGLAVGALVVRIRDRGMLADVRIRETECARIDKQAAILVESATRILHRDLTPIDNLGVFPASWGAPAAADAWIGDQASAADAWIDGPAGPGSLEIPAYFGDTTANSDPAPDAAGEVEPRVRRRLRPDWRAALDWIRGRADEFANRPLFTGEHPTVAAPAMPWDRIEPVDAHLDPAPIVMLQAPSPTLPDEPDETDDPADPLGEPDDLPVDAVAAVRRIDLPPSLRDRYRGHHRAPRRTAGVR